MDEIEHTWIPLPGGTRLAARIWLPADALAQPVPAILEYLPYRKRDGTRARDALTHPWFAAHGYACVRVDVRGSGESEGLLDDEYSAQEISDAPHVIAWIARQPWCAGAVGMMGISWGGFNALQVAALRPPALKAIITLCSTDDRYADDVHYMGGAVLTSTFGWGMALTSFAAHPPDPALVGDAWRSMWRARLDHLPSFVARWLRHPARDAYWKHGSVCEDYAAIACPVFAIGGWTDAYTNAIPRLLENLRVPRQALIGPWAHAYPHFAKPGPSGGFLQEALAWWNRWLKDAADTPAPPLLRAWMMESVRPAPYHGERPGRWIAEGRWPPATEPHRLHLAGGELRETPGDPHAVRVRSPQHLGAAGGNWCPFGAAPDDADDQREDDALSACWDSPPLAERLEILGAPELRLTLSCDAPAANLIVRLCDVHPDGASLRVSYGVLNLAHRNGHEAATPLEPGRRYEVRLKLNDTAFAFPAGHRIRVALSTAYWPIVWPAPFDATVTIDEEAAVLTLPRRRSRDEDAAVVVPPAETAPAEPRTTLREGASVRERGRDIGAGESFFRAVETPSRVRFDAIGTEVGMEFRTEYRLRDDDPLSARVETMRRQVLSRSGNEARTELRARMSADQASFRLELVLEAFEGETLVARREWDERVPRGA
ncbi:MAG TPA: CocE/NonD family hydrolase [Acetobacteraceae bacterium]|nr:CocE/NonD family hydrolase [Acetobacteraceae bacterium]